MWISHILHERFSICCVKSSNEYNSFDAMAKQTPYRYSADAKEIIRNVHDFCKLETESDEGTGINNDRGQQKYNRVDNETRQGKRTETTAYMYQNVKGST